MGEMFKISKALAATQMTDHYLAVLEFMQCAKQDTPSYVRIPDEDVRVLRARLVLEEALELVEALGVDVEFPNVHDPEIDYAALHFDDLRFGPRKDHVIASAEVAKECADVAVVNTGTLVAFGIPDKALLELVDNNNLEKFGPGHSYDDYGKLIKPPGFKKPAMLSFVKSVNNILGIARVADVHADVAEALVPMNMLEGAPSSDKDALDTPREMHVNIADNVVVDASVFESSNDGMKDSLEVTAEDVGTVEEVIGAETLEEAAKGVAVKPTVKVSYPKSTPTGFVFSLVPEVYTTVPKGYPTLHNALANREKFVTLLKGRGYLVVVAKADA